MKRIKPMSGAEAREIRTELGWTMKEAGVAIGLAGKSAGTNFYNRETGKPKLTLSQAELLRAYRGGYRPIE